jgi:hypothetical protein
MVMPLLALFLLAGQDVAAPGPVEVEVGVDGIADVPAQGYRVTGYFYAMEATPAESGSKVREAQETAADAIRALKPLDRDVCVPVFPKLGFVGNEAVGGPDSQEVPGMVPQFASYEAVLPDRQTAERAAAALRGAGAQNVQGPEAVLFDCAEGERLAQADALARARTKAEPYARLLGRRIAGIRRISQDAVPDLMQRYAGMFGPKVPKQDPDKVRVSAAVTVTYLLDK